MLDIFDNPVCLGNFRLKKPKKINSDTIVILEHTNVFLKKLFSLRRMLVAGFYHSCSSFSHESTISINCAYKTYFMKQFFFLSVFVVAFQAINAQKLPPASPCLSDEIYRQFDFWIGDWEAFNLQGKKAGDSKISLILDSCAILEEWSSVPVRGGFIYKGKSMNTYNSTTKQWQQTWVDNVGGNTQFVRGKYDDDKIIFQTDPYQYSKDTVAIRRLTFFNLGPDEVRQLGEISKDNGQTWATEYDLEYRRKKK